MRTLLFVELFILPGGHRCLLNLKECAQLNLLARKLSCAPELSYPAPAFRQDVVGMEHELTVSSPAASTTTGVATTATPAATSAAEAAAAGIVGGTAS